MAKTFSTNDIDTSLTQEIELPATGKIERGDAMFDDKIEIVNEVQFRAFHDSEKFMNQVLTVETLESSDPNAEQFIQTYVNGTPQFFERGKTQKVKRMFVEALARARPYTMQTPEIIDANGNRSTKIVKTFALKNAFNVLHDPAGAKGQQWLKDIIHQGS